MSQIFSDESVALVRGGFKQAELNALLLLPECDEIANLKGEFRAICRFLLFDGIILFGHRLIDSRWFERNPPTESG